METYHSRVYTDRPEYADYDAPRKFQAITGIIAGRRVKIPKQPFIKFMREGRL